MEGKGILEFDLSDPHQEIDFRLAVHSSDLALLLLDIRMELRNKAKHGEDAHKWYEARDLVFGMIRESGLDDLLERIP